MNVFACLRTRFIVEGLHSQSRYIVKSSFCNDWWTRASIYPENSGEATEAPEEPRLDQQAGGRSGIPARGP
jgi:hypothetical protein